MSILKNVCFYKYNKINICTEVKPNLNLFDQSVIFFLLAIEIK